jgi:hypothetical protein
MIRDIRSHWVFRTGGFPRNLSLFFRMENMSRFTKALATTAAGTALAAVAAVGMAPGASAVTQTTIVPGAHTVVTWSYASPSYPAGTYRMVRAEVRQGAAYAYAWAWTTSSRCTLMAAATVKPMPLSAWKIVCS